MAIQFPKITLDEGINIKDLTTTGSTFKIDEVYDINDDHDPEPYQAETKVLDLIGEPVSDFRSVAKTMTQIDTNGFVKKKILEQGGGFPLKEDCTVLIAFSCYWEDDEQPFDSITTRKPMEVDLKDNGLLPGLQMAIQSMLVGELSLFLLSHEVMYGELGVPPRIKPKATCAAYIKLIKSVLTPKNRKINYSEPNMFERVHNEVKLLFSSGYTLFKSNNYTSAINLFRKAVYMLHRCRLADESEEKMQEKLLKKLYLNLAICYIKIKQPLKACTACNELNRLNNLWNNGKALFQNAKALRMIGQYDAAEKRLLRALKLNPKVEKDIKAEWEILKSCRDACDQSKLISKRLMKESELVSDHFKEELNKLIKNFKENMDLCKLELPAKLNSDEMAYVKEICIRENLFFSKIPMNSANRDYEEEKTCETNFNHYFLDKKQDNFSDRDDCTSVELEGNDNILV